MSIFRRLIIFIVIILFVNYVGYYIVQSAGIKGQDSLPLILWFNALAIFTVILPPLSGVVFETGEKVIKDTTSL